MVARRYGSCTSGGDTHPSGVFHEQTVARPRRGIWSEEDGRWVLQHRPHLSHPVVASRPLRGLPLRDFVDSSETSGDRRQSSDRREGGPEGGRRGAKRATSPVTYV